MDVLVPGLGQQPLLGAAAIASHVLHEVHHALRTFNGPVAVGVLPSILSGILPRAVTFTLVVIPHRQVAGWGVDELVATGANSPPLASSFFLVFFT